MARPADPHARDALIAAARAEFVRKGIHGARIEDITAACGLSKGAFYLHFESKEALFGELVQAFTARLAQDSEARVRDMAAFLLEEGMLSDRDFAEDSARYQRFVQLEVRHDLSTLEAMWDARDVLDVLIRGSQGTAFQSLVWDLVDAEVQRVAQNFATIQGGCQARSDIDPQIFASFVVGTYLLVGKQMVQQQEKPDLAALACSLQRLIREGASPRPAPAALPQPAAPRRAVRPKPSAKPATAKPSARSGGTRASTRRPKRS